MAKSQHHAKSRRHALEADGNQERYVPRPLPGGSYHVEGLGRFIDNLFGDARAHRRARREMEPILLREDEMPPDPPPSEPPPPLPGGHRDVQLAGGRHRVGRRPA
jgi:hypothetical protein